MKLLALKSLSLIHIYSFHRTIYSDIQLSDQYSDQKNAGDCPQGELAIFLTLFAGFWLGRLKIGKFSLGTVTSVLLVGVLVGQLNITVDGQMCIRDRDGTFCLERGTLVGYEKFFHREFNITAKQESILYWSEEQKGWRRFMIGNLMEWRAIV